MSAVPNEIAIATTERMVLAPARYVLLPVAHLLTGYTVKAMERKIERGDWQEGKVWRHAPDGHIMIDMQGFSVSVCLLDDTLTRLWDAPVETPGLRWGR